VLTAVLALTAAGLALNIYFGYSGSGQMYSPELVAAKLRLLRIPTVLWLLWVLTVAVLELRQPQCAELSPKQKIPAYSKSVRLAALAAAVTAGVWLLVYLCNTENFASRDLEYTVGMLLLNSFPCAAILLAAAYFLQHPASPKPKNTDAKRLLCVRVGLAVLALILVVAGVANGGMRDVLVKAINICTECIGLG